MKKVKIGNFGKFISKKDARNQIHAIPELCGLVGMDKPFTRNEVFLEFDNEENQQKSILVMRQFNPNWSISLAAKRDFAKRRKNETEGEDEEAKRRRESRTIVDSVTPLAHLPYETQLEQKKKASTTILTQLFNELYIQWKPATVPIPSYLEAFTYGSQTLPIPFDDIVPAPKVTAYRNNCEFTCGVDRKGEPAVGFLLGRFSEGFETVEHPGACMHITEENKQVCTVMQQFIAKHWDKHKTYSKKTHTGFWRLVKVRQNQENEMLVMVQMNPKAIEKEELETLKQELVEYLVAFTKDSASPKLNIAGLYFNYWDGMNNAATPDSPLDLMFGQPIIEETVLGIKFQISPFSFFQVNTTAVEKLYTIARDWAASDPNTTVLDVCCGTGTIGLTMAKSVKQVIGIELVQAAVDDANKNAIRNGITNAVFVCGKAEEVMKKIVAEYKLDEVKNIVAIVDPPRGGLHKDVLRSLLNSHTINRVVYVSCNPKSLVENAQKLCKPTHRFPFSPTRAVVVDMFPHTEHSEMVMLFEREKAR